MVNKRTVIVDYGVGNLMSIKRSLEKFGELVEISSNPEQISIASRLVLPGVGAFPRAMHELSRLNLIDSVKEFISSGRPVLAICLGAQILLDFSEEIQRTNGLGIIKGEVIAIPNLDSFGNSLKVPHIGWSKVTSTNENGDLFLDGEFYFVHSYMLSLKKSKNIAANTNYGNISIPAVIQQDNLVGCQFHPEKSGTDGLQFIESFLLK